MDNPCTHLPIELWFQILPLASGHATKDEFAEQAESFESFPRDSNTIFTEMEHREESIVLSTRLSLVLVCKSWYPVAIELLWSHVRLIANKSAGSIENILDVLQEKPHLGRLVKRLTIRAQTAPYHGREMRENSNNSTICSILKYLPNVNVLTCPSTYSIPDITHPSVAIVYRGPSKTKPATSINPQHTYGHFNHAWYHARMLSIDFPTIAERPYGIIIPFPHLEILFIVLETGFSVNYVAEHWSMPSLRFLSILGGSELDCLSLLQSTSASLEYLQLNMRNFQSKFWPNRIELPNLTSLYISLIHGSCGGNSTITTTLGLFKAPNLRCLGIYNIMLGNPPSSELIKHVDAAIKEYPSLEEIYLEGHMKLVGTDGRITPQNILSLCRNGRLVKVRSGKGAWTTYSCQ